MHLFQKAIHRVQHAILWEKSMLLSLPFYKASREADTCSCQLLYSTHHHLDFGPADLSKNKIADLVTKCHGCWLSSY